ncbi:MAG: hypothetical protein HYZ42_02145 [Bacteroidetes bacterium]|nr:hypothetical protein [Bacteroidota bacterium]
MTDIHAWVDLIDYNMTYIHAWGDLIDMWVASAGFRVVFVKLMVGWVGCYWLRWIFGFNSEHT